LTANGKALPAAKAAAAPFTRVIILMPPPLLFLLMNIIRILEKNSAMTAVLVQIITNNGIIIHILVVKSDEPFMTIEDHYHRDTPKTTCHPCQETTTRQII